ncbi:MAG: anaerobic glycerol-3-phosphate dehydrogenase subunit C [Pirellulales bacterium]|nr:anaerobic glycerol-3-phosphate dehydrogenase subunit C [Pirellulales bacterium]
MDPQRQRIQEDLRGLISGDVRCDDLFCELYACDASLYQITPLGVIRPRTTEDVAIALHYASEKNISIHARGAGTGLAGESLGSGLVLDFSRYMRRVISIDDQTVRLQPGVVHARLNEQLRPLGKHFGPDPALSQVTTMGSVLAIDASGSHWLAYGSARRHIRSLEIVLADGTVLEVARETVPGWSDSATGDTLPRDARRRDLLAGLAELLEREEQTIAANQPRTLVNRAGYHLEGILREGHIDLPKLICGSEGTLALITAATLDVQALPRYKVAALVCFATIEQALLAVPELLAYQPCALDFLDRRHLSLAREADPRYTPIVPGETEGLLLIEFAGDDLQAQQDLLRQATDKVRKQKHLAFDVRIAADHQELRHYWRLARRVTPTLQRVRGSARPLPFVEDVAVPPDTLADYLFRIQNVLKRHQVTASVYGHVGHGQLHIRPFLDLLEPSDLGKLDALAADIYTETLAVGGTISGEHADGLTRTPFLRQQYGDLYPVFSRVKQLFDPKNLLNPGKIVSVDAAALTERLRAGFAAPFALAAPPSGLTGNSDAAPASLEHESPTTLTGGDLTSATSASGSPLATLPEAESASRATPPVLDLQLRWTQADVMAEVRGCNGCGVCRTQLPDSRMCPIFRVGPGEEASPRAKANLLRGVLTGQLPWQNLKTDEYKQVADLCVNCHQCRLECPTNVDIPRLMIEAKAAYVATNGLDLGDWFLAHIDRVSAWASLWPGLANWILENRQARWLLERIWGVAHNRKLPRLGRQTFQRWAARRKLTRLQRRGKRKVLYFADTFVNYYDTQLGQALVAILEHHGITVYVPPDPLHSGMPLVTVGALDAARKLVRKNIRVLAEAIRQGYSVVTTEPAAALCLTRDYPVLVDDDDARLVARQTQEACSYLWGLHQQGELLLDLNPIHATVAYHHPCHARALQGGAAAENLLRLIAGLQVQAADKGCSGMAGMYGMGKQNFRTSLRAGWGLISALRERTIQAGATECSACKLQMEQGADKATWHPLKWLALSYNLLPELHDQWQRRTE